MKTYQTSSSKETEKIGEEIAKNLIGVKSKDPRQKGAPIFALRGNLGSGKTTFTKGFFRGLGIKSRVKSPTFIIMRRSVVRGEKFNNVFHIDAYRLHQRQDFSALDFKTIASDEKNIILIEWPENAKGLIPRTAHRLEFRHGKKENERTIIIK